MNELRKSLNNILKTKQINKKNKYFLKAILGKELNLKNLFFS